MVNYLCLVCIKIMRIARTIFTITVFLASVNSFAGKGVEQLCTHTNAVDLSMIMNHQSEYREYIKDDIFVVYEGSLIRNVLEFSKFFNLSPILLKTGEVKDAVWTSHISI